MRNILDPENTDGLPEQKAGVKYVLGGRSFSTYRGDDKGMNQVFDSGGDSKQGDIASGGSAFVADRDNPCGYPLVLTSCEVSGTLAAYRVNEGKGNRAKSENPFAGDNGQVGNGGIQAVRFRWPAIPLCSRALRLRSPTRWRLESVRHFAGKAWYPAMRPLSMMKSTAAKTCPASTSLNGTFQQQMACMLEGDTRYPAQAPALLKLAHTA